jgi:hypothetical protein
MFLVRPYLLLQKGLTRVLRRQRLVAGLSLVSQTLASMVLFFQLIQRAALVHPKRLPRESQQMRFYVRPVGRLSLPLLDTTIGLLFLLPLFQLQSSLKRRRVSFKITVKVEANV